MKEFNNHLTINQVQFGGVNMMHIVTFKLSPSQIKSQTVEINYNMAYGSSEGTF